MEEIIPFCPNCGKELKKIKGKWGMFWSCSNWKQCGFKGKSIKGEINPDMVKSENNGNQIVMEELANITKGLREIWKLLDIINAKIDKLEK